MGGKHNSFQNLWRKMPLLWLILISTLILSLIGLIGLNSRFKDFRKLDFRKEPLFAATIFGIKDSLNGDETLILPAKAIRHDKQSIANKEAAKEGGSGTDQKAGGNIAQPSGVRLTIPDGVNSPVCTAADYGVADSSVMADLTESFNSDTDGMFAPNGTYRYLQPASDDSYFNDALIIGDSRTVGLYYWGGLKENTNFFCKESMSIYNVTKKNLEYHAMNGEEGETDLVTLLSTHNYGKVYICLGINELGSYVWDYYNAYRDVLTQIRTLQPNALIFIEGNMHIGGTMSSTDPIFNNTNLVQRNVAISSLANGRDIFYIDMNPVLVDGDGNLIAEYSNDQIHVKAEYYHLWSDFLRQNTIDPNIAPK